MCMFFKIQTVKKYSQLINQENSVLWGYVRKLSYPGMLRLCFKSQCKRVLHLVPRRKQTCLLKNMAMFGTPNWKLTAGLPKHHPLLKREIIWTESAWNEFHVNFPVYIHLGFPGCNQPEWNPTRFFSHAIAGRLPSISNATLWQLSRGWVWLVGWLVLFATLIDVWQLVVWKSPSHFWVGWLGFCTHNQLLTITIKGLLSLNHLSRTWWIQVGENRFSLVVSQPLGGTIQP